MATVTVDLNNLAADVEVEVYPHGLFKNHTVTEVEGLKEDVVLVVDHVLPTEEEIEEAKAAEAERAEALAIASQLGMEPVFEDEAPVNLAKLTRAQLDAVAEERGLVPTEYSTKDELLEALAEPQEG
jgi:hypothetical protein